MIYYIYNNGQLVSTQKSINKASLYIRTNHGLRGFSNKTIKNKLSNNNTYTKNNITIEKKQNYSNTRVIPKKIRTYQDIRIGTTEILNYQRPIYLNQLNSDDFVKLIMEKLKTKGLNFLKNNRIKVVISGSGRTIGTTFLDFNSLYEDLIFRINNYLLEYDAEDLEISMVRILYAGTPPLDELLIYKGNEKNAKTFINDIINMKINDKEKFIKFISNYQIISPSTTENCFIKACFIAKHKKKNINKHSEKFIKKLGKLEKNIKTLGPLLSQYLEVNIIVHFVDKDITKFNYKMSKEYETINIVIKGGHAYALVDIEKKDKDYLEQTLIEIPDYENNKREIATYDLETCDKEDETLTKNNTEVYALGYYNGKEYKEIYKKDKDNNVLIKFINYLYYDESSNKIIYAHNGGKFDTFLLLKELLISNKFFITSYLESNGRIINMTIKAINKNKSFEFRDSINFIACSLDKACNDFKPTTKKLTGDVDHDKININNCYTKEIYKYTKDYLKNDCISLYEILNIFDSNIYKAYKFNITDILTNASIARRVFLDKYYDVDNKPLYTLDRYTDNELRKYYFGGRNECMTKLGYNKGKFYYVDFTSLYPYVMKKNKYFYGKMNKIVLKDNSKFDNNWFGFVKVLFRHTNKNNIPLHGVLAKTNKSTKLVFPYVEEWRESIISTEEIKYSLNNNLGYEYKYLMVYNWINKDNYFEPIIDELYKMKLDAQKKGNKALRSIGKIIINSTYGFFGINYLKRDQIEIVNERANKHKTPEESRTCRFYGYLIDQKLKSYNKYGKYDIYGLESSINAKCANVGIASLVTSYARLELYKLLKAIKDEGGNIYYMDTDSVITDLNIYENDKFKSFIGSGGENLGELTNEAFDEYEDEIKALYMDKVKKDNPKIKDKEKLDKIYKKLYKKKVEDYMEKTYKKLCCEEDDEKKKTPHYKELITLGNKMYALNTDFEYEFEGKKTILKTKIIKMKGINSKQRYTEKYINHENKKVYYKSINKLEGDKKIDFDDYKLLSNGYELIVDNMNFITGSKQMIIKDNGLIKQRNNKTIKSLYDKANVNNNIISPLCL